MDCIFCSIASGKIPATVVFENDKVLAFEDIHPEAPVHILVIPKKHISGLDQLEENDRDIAAELLMAIKKIAEEKGLADKGYRVVTNVGEDGGQTVSHLHFHLLGGRSLQWPPG